MTVGELIEKLQTYDKDAPVEIIDADTGWLIEKIHIDKGPCGPYASETNENTVYMWGAYCDMKGMVSWS